MRSSTLLSSSLRSCTRTATPKICPLFYSRTHMSGIPSKTAQIQKQANMSTSTSSGNGEYEIQTTPNAAPGVELSSQQKVLVGSVLDLFKGYPTLKKLSLWTDDATFADPLTQAQGRKQYQAQWYGLATAFSTIEQQSQTVTSAGNPITLDLKTRYVVKGLGTEKVINSKINIHTDSTGEKIVKVEDRWDGEIPEGPFAKVGDFFSFHGLSVVAGRVLNPFWWGRYWRDWGFYGLSCIWETRGWEAFRNLNSVVVPAFVGVPKNEEEDAKKGK